MSYNTFKGHGPSLLSHSAKLLRLLFVLAMIVGIILCATELFFRVIDFADLRPDSAERALNGGDAVQLNSELGWVQIPNIVTQAYTGNRTISVKHNSLGLRENELLEDAPNGTFIFLGDSMVWGTRFGDKRAIYRSPATGATTAPDSQCWRSRIRDRPGIAAIATVVGSRKAKGCHFDVLGR